MTDHWWSSSLWFPVNFSAYIEARKFGGRTFFMDNCKHVRPTPWLSTKYDWWSRCFIRPVSVWLDWSYLSAAQILVRNSTSTLLYKIHSNLTYTYAHLPFCNVNYTKVSYLGVVHIAERERWHLLTLNLENVMRKITFFSLFSTLLWETEPNWIGV